MVDSDDDELLPEDEATDFDAEAPSSDFAHRMVQAFSAGFSQIGLWWSTRRWWRMLEGLPAIIVAGLILMPAVLSGYVNPARLTNRYKFEVGRAIAQNDAESAEMFLRKLIGLNAIDPDMRYAMAFVAERKGEQERANEILTELASVADGHPGAHFWKAKQLARRESPLSAEERQALIQHLMVALKAEPPPIEASVMLGQIYLEAKEYDKAIQFFESVLPQRPELHLNLGQIHLQRGDKVRAKSELQESADYFQRRVQATPTDVNCRVAWALSRRLLSDFAEAKEILLSGLKLEPSNAMLREVMASFYLDEFDALDPTDDSKLDRRLELLEAALTFAPNSLPTLNRLAAFCAAEGEAGERARAKMKEVLAEGKATATVHLLLGIQAATQGDTKRAELHFEQGQRLNPRVPELLNNFAWLLSRQEKPNLDRALTLVNQALEIQPNHPTIRETRGQIYVKLERWRDALADLEFALPKMPNNRDLHAALARVYTQLGDPEIAEKHAKLANGK